MTRRNVCFVFNVDCNLMFLQCSMNTIGWTNALYLQHLPFHKVIVFLCKGYPVKKYCILVENSSDIYSLWPISLTVQRDFTIIIL